MAAVGVVGYVGDSARSPYFDNGLWPQHLLIYAFAASTRTGTRARRRPS